MSDINSMSCREPLPPVRGLIPIHNRRGKPISSVTLHRWMRLARLSFKVHKIDILAYGSLPERLPHIIGYGRLEGLNVPLTLPISLRTNCEDTPACLDVLSKWAMPDVFLCPVKTDAVQYEAWLFSCHQHGLPIRVQVVPPFSGDFDPARFVSQAKDAGVTVIQIMLDDPFQPYPRCLTKRDSEQALEQTNALAIAAREAGLEVNLYGFPLCLLEPSTRECAGGPQRFFLDIQQYEWRSYELAARLYRVRTAFINLAIPAYLGRNIAYRNLADEAFLRWLVMGNHHRLQDIFSIASKIVKKTGLMPASAKVVEHPEAVYRDEILHRDASKERQVPSECAECSYIRVCGRWNRTVSRRLPGVKPKADQGQTVASPLTGLIHQEKKLDAIDQQRIKENQVWESMARDVARLMQEATPTPFGFDDIRPENAYSMRMPGAYRYLSLTDRELISTILYWGEAPFIVSVTFGGGIANLVGFSIWNNIKLVCPMLACSHQLVLYVAADGQYVMLRDGIPVRPVELEGKYYVPQRMPSVVPVRLSMWGVETALCTQNPQLWRPESLMDVQQREKTKVRYSVIVVSTRYTRRLQACLQCLAHQEGIHPGELEVIVGYVPGIDATDDVISSVQLTYPGFRVLRSPFPEHQAHAKGFIINQSRLMASGEWLIILDADTLLAPSTFISLGQLPDHVFIAAPMGRKMLTREVTASILLGEVKPWESWDILIAGPGENRYGDQREGGVVPVGFCQCVRASAYDAVQYNEYEHFEGADFEFADEVIRRFGACVWLDIPTLHLDHGGSQWYGVKGHL